MSNKPVSKAWMYMSIIPSLVAALGIVLVTSANLMQWGAESEIPAARLMALFFAEITMVACGLGIAGYVKSPNKTPKIKLLGLWNLCLLIVSGILGYKIFSSL